MGYSLSIDRKDNKTIGLLFENPFNEKGIVFRITSVLYVHDYNICEARAETSPEGLVRDTFIIESTSGAKFTKKTEKEIRQDLTALFSKETTPMQYLSMHPEKIEKLTSRASAPGGSTISFTEDNKDSVTIMHIDTEDRPGLLFEISQLLYMLYVDILSFEAGSHIGQAHDTFYLKKEDGSRLDDYTRKKVEESLKKIL